MTTPSTLIEAHQEAYDGQLLASLERRFVILCLVLAGLVVVDMAWFCISSLPDSVSAITTAMWIRLAGYPVALGVAGWAIYWRRSGPHTIQQLNSMLTGVLIGFGFIPLLTRLIVHHEMRDIVPDYTSWGLLDLFVLHMATSLILPWEPRETSRPMIPLLLVWGVTIVASVQPAGAPDVGHLVAIIMSWLILVPGWIASTVRMTRHRERFEHDVLGQQVTTAAGELSRARIVHDAMFPRQFDDGYVTFEYEYNPIAEIGGDYVHLHVCKGTSRVTVTLLDVAGHGLAAALTVNRLFGELERIRAENPSAGPAEIMVLLNRYINLTMAKHDLYATGACICIDPFTGQLDWVSAGHPPALLRRATGDLEDLSATAVLLGALGPGDFEPHQQAIRLRPGDSVIAYTDGAFEARNGAGSRFGLDALRSTALFNPPPRSWPKFITNAVAKHHEGHADDDVLIAALAFRRLRVGVPGPARAESATAVVSSA